MLRKKAAKPPRRDPKRGLQRTEWTNLDIFVTRLACFDRCNAVVRGEASRTNKRKLKGDLCVLHPDRKQFNVISEICFFRSGALVDPRAFGRLTSTHFDTRRNDEAYMHANNDMHYADERKITQIPAIDCTKHIRRYTYISFLQFIFFIHVTFSSGSFRTSCVTS